MNALICLGLSGAVVISVLLVVMGRAAVRELKERRRRVEAYWHWLGFEKYHGIPFVDRGAVHPIRRLRR